MNALSLSPHSSLKESKTNPRELLFRFYYQHFIFYNFAFFLVEENPKSDDEGDLEIIVDSLPSMEHSAASTSTLPPSYDQAVFTTSSLISLATTTTTLPTPSFQDSFKNFSFLHFPVHPVQDSPSTSLSSLPSYSDSLFSLSTHAPMDRPSFSSSHTLTSSFPSSLPPPYPI